MTMATPLLTATTHGVAAVVVAAGEDEVTTVHEADLLKTKGDIFSCS